MRNPPTLNLLKYEANYAVCDEYRLLSVNDTKKTRDYFNGSAWGTSHPRFFMLALTLGGVVKVS